MRYEMMLPRQIRAAIDVPLALHLGSPRDVVNAIKAEACDHFNLGGGMVEFVRMASMAAAYGSNVWHGSGVDLGIAEHAYLHACAATRNCVLPSDLVGSWVREHMLVQAPMTFTDEIWHSIEPIYAEILRHPWRDRDRLLPGSGRGVRDRQISDPQYVSASNGRMSRPFQIDNHARAVLAGVRWAAARRWSWSTP